MSEPGAALPGGAGTAGGEPIHPQAATPRGAEPESKRSDLPARLLTAAVLVPTVVYVIYLGGLAAVALVIGIILIGQREVYRLIEDKGAHPVTGFGLAAGAALPVVMYVGNEYHATILMTVTLLAVMVLQLGKAQVTEALASISGTFFGLFYVGWLLSHAIVLRNIHAAVASRWGPWTATDLQLHPQSGIFLLLFAIAVVVLTDAGAYFAGRAFGKRKLAPRISPSKSVEGAVGGVLAGVAAGFIVKGVFDLAWPALSASLPWAVAGGFAFAVALAGTLGDLIESLLKRDARRKDAGSLLPGMGGILDRIDSALLGIPVMYYLFLCFVYVRAT